MSKLVTTYQQLNTIRRDLKNQYWELHQLVGSHAYKNPLNQENDLVQLGHIVSAVSLIRKAQESIDKVTTETFCEAQDSEN